MTINVYPSLLEGEPIERHPWAGSIADWFASKDIDYAARKTQPVTVRLNGRDLPADTWCVTFVTNADDVDIRPIPGDTSTWIYLAIMLVSTIVSIVTRPKTPRYNAPPQSQQLLASQAQANQAKLGSVVPELCGQFKRFPDYITAPRRYFSNLREQWLQFHCCIGPGSYQIDDGNVRVGDTPFSSLGDDGAYQLFEPGADLSAVDTHENWYTVPEIGGTSSGSAGLALTTEIANRTNAQPASYDYSGSTVTRVDGEYPPGWGQGTKVTISLPLTYSVTTETIGGQSYNKFNGHFSHILPLGQVDASGGLTGAFDIADSELDSNGDGWITLNTPAVPATDDSPGTAAEPFSGLSPGNYSIAFQLAGAAYTIDAMTDTSLTIERDQAGWRGFPLATAGGSVIFSGGQVYGEWTNEFILTPEKQTTMKLEIDLFMPGGLCHLSDEGDVQARSVGIDIQYRDSSGGGAETTVHRVYTQATVDQIGMTEALAIPEMRPAVRVRRTGAESTSVQDNDTINWYGAKAQLSTAPTSYPRWTTMSVRLRSGNKLASQSENQINVIVTRMLPTLQVDGTWGSPTATRDISAFLRYIAQTIGYSDEKLDIDELARLHGVWTSRGETSDGVFDVTTVKDAMNDVLAAGMAELTIAAGRIRPVREGVRTQFEQPYSPQNMTEGLKRTFTAKRQDDSDGVEVTYTDAETWTQKTVVAALPGSEKVKLEKMTLATVTDLTRAWRIGMRRARAIKYRRWQYEFSTELDALNSEYMSYVPLQDDIPGYGQSALLDSIAAAAGGALLRVTEPLRWEAGKNHVVAYRNPDGTLAGPWAATQGPDDFSLIADIPAPWPSVTLAQELPHVYFGTIDRWCFPALITEIRPQDSSNVAVTAVNYDSRVYDDDDNAPT